MNSKRQLTAIKNRNWTSKSERENAKYVRAKLEMLGYNVPAYMKKGQINQEQLEFYTNRILNRLTKEVEKERRNKMSRGEKRREDRDKKERQLNNLIKQNNKQVKEVHKFIDENFTGWEADYLKGLQTDAPIISDRFQTRSNSPHFVGNLEGSLDAKLKTLKQKVKDSKLENFKASLDEANKNADADFKQFLNEAWIVNNKGFSTEYLANMENGWEMLNVAEKEMMMRGVFELMREIYGEMDEKDYKDPVSTAYEAFKSNYERIKELKNERVGM